MTVSEDTERWYARAQRFWLARAANTRLPVGARQDAREIADYWGRELSLWRRFPKPSAVS